MFARPRSFYIDRFCTGFLSKLFNFMNECYGLCLHNRNKYSQSIRFIFMVFILAISAHLFAAVHSM